MLKDYFDFFYFLGEGDLETALSLAGKIINYFPDSEDFYNNPSRCLL